MGATALLVIGVQKGLDDPSLGKEQSRSGVEYCVAAVCVAQKCHADHSRSALLSGTGLTPSPRASGQCNQRGSATLASRKAVQQTGNSAFIGTGLDAYLREEDIASLVIVGLTADHCVSASTRMASDLGFDVTLISDATAAFGREGYDGVLYSGDLIHKVNVVSLDGEFCVVRSTAEMLEALA